MPELPEVETVRRGLQSRLPGRRIEKVRVFRPDSIALPSVQTFRRRLKGKVFAAVRRRGKYLLLDLEPGGTLVVHLRMSGRLLFIPSSSALCPAAGQALTPFERIRFELNGADFLVFDDMRVFGRAWYLPSGSVPEAEISGIAHLGPEPLEDLSAEYLMLKFAGKTQPIKSALLDQRIIAGIGNIYADEVLHLAGISPATSAGALSAVQLEKLTGAIRHVLTEAIERGGSSIRDYTDADGFSGSYQTQALVYGRTGQACKMCTEPIMRVKLSGRSAHYCPRCQPSRKVF